jgi:hypothetical protein
MERMSVPARVLGTIGVVLIGTICVAVERLPNGAARLVIGAIRLFGRAIDAFPVHLIYSRSGRPAQPPDSGVRRVTHQM